MQDDDLKMISLRLRASDLEKLRSYYPSAGYNKAIRELVSRHVRDLEEKLSKKLEIKDDIKL